MDKDALITVAEDLEYLATWGGEISDAEIRRGSAILRRLLVEDVYAQAWRAIGLEKQPSLIAVDLELCIGSRLGEIELALAGGADIKGMQYALLMLNKGPVAIGGQPPEPIREGGYPFDQNYDLTRYLKSAAGVVSGDAFNRREVIKYIANVKGGVHLSLKERKQEEKLVARLGKIEKRLMLQFSDALLIEIVAIGQSLGWSPDAKLYISHARGAA